MSHSDVDKIKERLGIEEVVGTYLKLERAGKNLKARCPFHNEKTPSFIISPDRGTYYCFGCGAKGDIFSFVQEFEGLDFSGALKVLADRAGIILTKTSDQNHHQNDVLRKILDFSAKFYQVHLGRNSEAQKYLASRGLEPKTITEWQIGFAPEGWEKLLDFLKTKKFKESDIEKAGLIKQGNKGKYYDRFRSRIMFPIADSGGRIIGFSGRVFGENKDEAKYINSPETPVFDKSETLYGFDKAKTAIRKNDFSILVEGQMDLIMSHQAGYKNTVASSGTALTDRQLEKIARISDKIVIAYDSDGAGFRASEKAWRMALSLGMDVKIAPIPAGQDPADIIQTDKKQWKEIIRNSRHIIEIIIDQIDEQNLSDRELGKTISSKLIPYLASIKSPIDQDHFMVLIKDRFKISMESLRSEINLFQKGNNNIDSYQKNVLPSSVSKESNLLEKNIFSILFWLESVSQSKIDLQKLKIDIKNVFEDEFNFWLDNFSPEREVLIFRAESLYDLNAKPEIVAKEIEELLRSLRIKKLKKTLRQLREDLLNEEAQANNEDKVKRLQEKIQSVSKQIDELKDYTVD